MIEAKFSALLARAGVVILGPVVGLHRAEIVGPCVLGPGVVIRAFAVLYAATGVGSSVQVGHAALVPERNVVGEGSLIGSGAHLEPGNAIAQRARIQSSAFLSSGTIGNDVFCGPHVAFTDDLHPPCPRNLDCVGGAVVEDRASIGARALMVPGVTIGAVALVGAGAVETRSGRRAMSSSAIQRVRLVGDRRWRARPAFSIVQMRGLVRSPIRAAPGRRPRGGSWTRRNDSSISTR